MGAGRSGPAPFVVPMRPGAAGSPWIADQQAVTASFRQPASSHGLLEPILKIGWADTA